MPSVERCPNVLKSLGQMSSSLLKINCKIKFAKSTTELKKPSGTPKYTVGSREESQTWILTSFEFLLIVFIFVMKVPRYS